MRHSNLNVNKDANTVSWYVNKKQVAIVREHLQNAMAYPKVNLVLALFAIHFSKCTLVGLSQSGILKFEVAAPDGFGFSHLTKHPEIDVAIVCWEDKDEGWSEWYFSVDPENGSLTKCGRVH